MIIFRGRASIRSREIMLTLGAAVYWNRGGSYTIDLILALEALMEIRLHTNERHHHAQATDLHPALVPSGGRTSLSNCRY